ncbi:nucleotidyltransferase family protein [Lachnospiraceae bacterium ZAX-1]
MLYVILLAAGYSKRFHGNKLLYPFKGKPLYLYTLEKLFCFCHNDSSGDNSNRTLFVVTQYDEILDTCQKRNIKAVKNKIQNTGIASSIQKGIEVVLEDVKSKLMIDDEEYHIMFCVADQPFMAMPLLESMQKNFLESEKGVGCMGYEENGKRTICNPIIFSKKYIPELLQLKGDEGGKKIVNRHTKDIYFYKIEQSIFFDDIDTESDLGKELYENYTVD